MMRSRGGRTLPDDTRLSCPSCGAQVRPEHRFCQECGAVLAPAAVSGASAPEPTFVSAAMQQQAPPDGPAWPEQTMEPPVGGAERGGSNALRNVLVVVAALLIAGSAVALAIALSSGGESSGDGGAPLTTGPEGGSGGGAPSDGAGANGGVSQAAAREVLTRYTSAYDARSLEELKSVLSPSLRRNPNTAVSCRTEDLNGALSKYRDQFARFASLHYVISGESLSGDGGAMVVNARYDISNAGRPISHGGIQFRIERESGDLKIRSIDIEPGGTDC
jgi:zinc-ribbon domain